MTLRSKKSHIFLASVTRLQNCFQCCKRVNSWMGCWLQIGMLVNIAQKKWECSFFLHFVSLVIIAKLDPNIPPFSYAYTIKYPRQPFYLLNYTFWMPLLQTPCIPLHQREKRDACSKLCNGCEHRPIAFTLYWHGFRLHSFSCPCECYSQYFQSRHLRACDNYLS